MKVYKFIPYDKNLVSRARGFRRTQTEAEKKFWQEVIKDIKLANFEFTRQKPIGNFIVDFYCAKFKLGIEVDGEVHTFQQVRDKERDNFLLQKFGIRILRYKNSDILNNPKKISADILKHLG